MGRHSNILLLDKDRKVITLGRQVQDLMQLEKLEQELESANGEQPSTLQGI